MPLVRGARRFAILLFVGVALASCAAMQNPRQIAYDACTDVHNNRFLGLGAYRALYVGISGGTTRCYWAWNASTLAEAQNSAFNSCRQEYEDCYLWADSNGMAPWVREISDNGGVDPSSGGSSGFADAFATGAMVGLGIGNALSGGGGYSTPSTGGYSTSDGGETYTHCATHDAAGPEYHHCLCAEIQDGVGILRSWTAATVPCWDAGIQEGRQ